MKAKRRTVLDVLKAARELVKRGWTQGPAHAVKRGRDCYCAYGAVSIAANDLSAKIEAFDVAGSHIRGWPHLTGAGRLIHFNEKRGRTKRQVLALFDKMIRKLEKSK